MRVFPGKTALTKETAADFSIFFVIRKPSRSMMIQYKCRHLNDCPSCRSAFATKFQYFIRHQSVIFSFSFTRSAFSIRYKKYFFRFLIGVFFSLSDIITPDHNDSDTYRDRPVFFSSSVPASLSEVFFSSSDLATESGRLYLHSPNRCLRSPFFRLLTYPECYLSVNLMFDSSSFFVF